MNFKSPFTMMMFLIMISSAFMAMSSSNWIMLWLALEVSMLSFIPIMFSSTNSQETEACIKYLLIQALGSSLLLIGSMYLYTAAPITDLAYSVILLALMVKTGIAPCHTWYPSIMASISWHSAFILSTWQKLAPLSVIMFVMTKTSTTVPMMMIASINAIVGGALGMNQSMLRTILAYSSITHMGWMLALISLTLSIQSLLYFILYSFLILPIFMVFNFMNSKTLAHMSKSVNTWITTTIMIPILMLSLGGLPPLLGFFPKFMVIFSLSQNSMMLLMVLVAGSLMNLYFYLNIALSILMSTDLFSSSKYSFSMLHSWIMFSFMTTLFIMPLMMLYALTLLN